MSGKLRWVQEQRQQDCELPRRPWLSKRQSETAEAGDNLGVILALLSWTAPSLFAFVSLLPRCRTRRRGGACWLVIPFLGLVPADRSRAQCKYLHYVRGPRGALQCGGHGYWGGFWAVGWSSRSKGKGLAWVGIRSTGTINEGAQPHQSRASQKERGNDWKEEK